MRFNRALLINLYYKESGYGDRLNFPPVGLGYLSQYLERENIAHDVIDTGAGLNEDDVFQKVKLFDPELLAFSLNSICFPRSLVLIAKLKKNFPNVAIVIGGPHASTKQAALLKENATIDFVIVKEGEIPLALLCKGEELGNIPGLIWRDKDKIIRSNGLKRLNINEFPYPLYRNFELSKNYNSGTIGIVTSRGCPFECAFCQQSSLLGKDWRSRTAASVIEEIEHWYNKGIASVHILDDNFGLDKKRIFEIADLLEQR
ncbi:MAG: cobalamin-dependent protein, partial [Candidatus Omnitrophota bacterium]